MRARPSRCDATKATLANADLGLLIDRARRRTATSLLAHIATLAREVGAVMVAMATTPGGLGRIAAQGLARIHCLVDAVIPLLLRFERFNSVTCGRSIDLSGCLAFQNLDWLHWRSLTTFATSSYGCSTLRPVIPSANFGGVCAAGAGRGPPVRRSRRTTRRLSRNTSLTAKAPSNLSIA
jgi:hypothetical protein